MGSGHTTLKGTHTVYAHQCNSWRH